MPARLPRIAGGQVGLAVGKWRAPPKNRKDLTYWFECNPKSIRNAGLNCAAVLPKSNMKAGAERKPIITLPRVDPPCWVCRTTKLTGRGGRRCLAGPLVKKQPLAALAAICPAPDDRRPLW